MSDLPDHLQTIIDKLCEQGCTAVTNTIDDIEAGNVPEALKPLHETERNVVLAELKDIMQIYQQN